LVAFHGKNVFPLLAQALRNGSESAREVALAGLSWKEFTDYADIPWGEVSALLSERIPREQNPSLREMMEWQLAFFSRRLGDSRWPEADLTAGEHKALFTYRSDSVDGSPCDFRDINRFFRDGVGSETIRTLAADFTTGLQKLPAFEMEGRPIARWTHVPEEELARIESNVGNVIVIDKAPMSFAPNDTQASHNFSDKSGFAVKLVALPSSRSSARDLTGISGTDSEVLYPPSHPMEVVSFKRNAAFFLPPSVRRDGKLDRYPMTSRILIELREPEGITPG
jgi:hypothetical protein